MYTIDKNYENLIDWRIWANSIFYYDKDLKVVVQVGDSVKKLAPSIEELEEYKRKY